jgi:hypothetical protein
MYLNLNYAYSCVSYVYVQSYTILAYMCICEVLEIYGVCFIVNIICLEKSDVPIFLVKPDVPVCQTGVSGFGRQNI